MRIKRILSFSKNYLFDKWKQQLYIMYTENYKNYIKLKLANI